MNDHTCILTIGDFSTLEGLLQRWTERGHDLAPRLRAKLEKAKVVFPDDLPRDIASLGSRIAFAIGEETHVSVLTATVLVDRDCLPVTLPVGLALLGQREGWAAMLEIEPSRSRSVTLGQVIEQPEASWPGRFTPKEALLSAPALRLVQGSRHDSTLRATGLHPDDDDPGPAAA